METQAIVNAVRDYIAHTTGTENHYQHALMKAFRYTDGIKYLAETAGAWWLVDLIASWQIKPSVKACQFQVWYVEAPKAPGEPWQVSCWTDTPYKGDSRAIAHQEIEYSDFPADLLPLTLWVEGGVLLLPAEH